MGFELFEWKLSRPDANIYTDSKDCAHKASQRTEDSTENWTRGHWCYIVAKNLVILCPCPETLKKAEFKGDKLINLARKFQGSPAFGCDMSIIVYF
jgi:hypothetical protein